MFNVGRNNPRVRAALIEALELERPGSVQIGVDVAACAARRGAAAPGAVERRPRAVHELGRGVRRGRDQARPRGNRPLARALGRARLPRPDARRALRERRAPSSPSGSVRCSRISSAYRSDDLDALERALLAEDVALFLVEPVQGKGVNLPPPGYLEGAQDALPPLRDALLRRRGADGLRPDGDACSRWSTGASSPTSFTVAKSLSGGYVPVGALLMSTAVYEAVFDSLRALVQPRLDVRAERPGDGGGPRHAARARRAGAGRALGAAGRAAARADAPAGRALRGRARRARPRAHVGDRVRGAEPGGSRS